MLTAGDGVPPGGREPAAVIRGATRAWPPVSSIGRFRPSEPGMALVLVEGRLSAGPDPVRLPEIGVALVLVERWRRLSRRTCRGGRAHPNR